MKLQPKRVVATEIAKQRKSQIDEGVKLAGKVDKLRSVVSEEEAKVERFRKESVTRVQVEIDDKIVEKNRLIEEIRILKEDRARDLIPLTLEWEKVKKEKERLIRQEEVVSTREDDATQREEEVKNLEYEVSIDKERVGQLKEATTQKLGEAEVDRIEAREFLATTKNKAQKIIFDAELKAHQAQSRIDGVEVWEREVAEREERVNDKETDLTRRELVLKDRYATLEREIKRNKKA